MFIRAVVCFDVEKQVTTEPIKVTHYSKVSKFNTIKYPLQYLIIQNSRNGQQHRHHHPSDFIKPKTHHINLVLPCYSNSTCFELVARITAASRHSFLQTRSPYLSLDQPPSLMFRRWISSL